MRTITYKCDRCKKPITSRGVTRINATIQRGGRSGGETEP